MNGSAIYITQFGAYVLHNGSTHYATSTIRESAKADFKPIQLPNGRLYDMYQSYDAPVSPAKFTCTLLLRLPKDSAIAEFEAIAALIGTRGIVTGKRNTTTGLTTTCTARLTGIANVNRDDKHFNNGLRLKLSFTPLDVWS